MIGYKITNCSGPFHLNFIGHTQNFARVDDCLIFTKENLENQMRSIGKESSLVTLHDTLYIFHRVELKVE